MSLGIPNGRGRWGSVVLCAATGLLVLHFADVVGSVWAFEPWQPQERWLIQSGRVAPWAKPGTTALENAGLAGQAILVEGKTVTAPHPLACEQAEHAFIVIPAEGLFEGGLPAPAGAAARALGMASMPVLTWRMTCRNGSFDYHLLSKQGALLGLDHVVWQVRRTSLELSPEAAVLELLRQHMTRDMAFTKGSAARKASMLTEGLTRAIATYFAGDYRRYLDCRQQSDPTAASRHAPLPLAKSANDLGQERCEHGAKLRQLLKKRNQGMRAKREWLAGS